ncbi:hypothetical protein ACTRXD_18870 [Nitrospira sp. T9]|uniref:hypothetical protein n=1 Tax=unclassified Nitrospira TaxID=2652172 RepID=UPI003F97C064
MDKKHTGASIAGFGFWLMVAVAELSSFSPPQWILVLAFCVGLIMIVYGTKPWIKEAYSGLKIIHFQWPFYLKNTSVSHNLYQGISAGQLSDSPLVVQFHENCFEECLEKNDNGIVRGSRKTYWIELHASGKDFLGVEVLVIRMDLLSQTDYQRGQLISLPSNTRLPNRDDENYIMNIPGNSKVCVSVVSFSDAVMNSFRLETEPYQTSSGEWGNRNFPAFPENVYKLWLGLFSEGQFIKSIEGIVAMKNERPNVEFYE